MTGLSFVFAAFLVVWVGIFLYILYWQRQVSELQAELHALQLARQEPEPSSN